MNKLFSRIYENNILVKLSNEHYFRMVSEYETEQKQPIDKVEENGKKFIKLQNKLRI